MKEKKDKSINGMKPAMFFAVTQLLMNGEKPTQKRVAELSGYARQTVKNNWGPVKDFIKKWKEEDGFAAKMKNQIRDMDPPKRRKKPITSPARTELLIEHTFTDLKTREEVELGFHSLKFWDYVEKFTELRERSTLSADKLMDIIISAEYDACFRGGEMLIQPMQLIRYCRNRFFYLQCFALGCGYGYGFREFMNDGLWTKKEFDQLTWEHIRTKNLERDVRVMFLAICKGLPIDERKKVISFFSDKIATQKDANKKYRHFIDRMRAATEKRKKQPQTQTQP